MHMEQRQRVDEDVVGGPLPGVLQRVQRRGERPAGEDGSLRRAGRPGGVHHQGGGLRVRLGERGGHRARGRGGDVHAVQAGQRGREHVAGGGQHQGGRAVRDDVRELPFPGFRVQRDGRHPGPQRGDHRDDGRRARRGPDGDADRAGEPGREGGRDLGQRGVGEGDVIEPDGFAGGRRTGRVLECGQKWHHPAHPRSVRGPRPWKPARMRPASRPGARRAPQPSR